MQGLGYIETKNEILLVLVRQSKYSWHYRLRKGTKKGFKVIDNDFFNSENGKIYIDKLKNGESIKL